MSSNKIKFILNTSGKNCFFIFLFKCVFCFYCFFFFIFNLYWISHERKKKYYAKSAFQQVKLDCIVCTIHKCGFSYLLRLFCLFCCCFPLFIFSLFTVQICVFISPPSLKCCCFGMQKTILQPSIEIIRKITAKINNDKTKKKIYC